MSNKKRPACEDCGSTERQRRRQCWVCSARLCTSCDLKHRDKHADDSAPSLSRPTDTAGYIAFAAGFAAGANGGVTVNEAFAEWSR